LGSSRAGEISVGELLGRRFESSAPARAASATASGALATFAPGSTVTPLAGLLLGLARNSRVRRRRGFGYAVLGRNAHHADHRILGAAAEKPAPFAFVEHRKLDFVDGGPEFRERLVTGVFDGFAACFGLIHWRSSIPER
jgi:hypothetical protein